MKEKEVMQISVVESEDAKTFQKEFNTEMASLSGSDPEVEFICERKFCAIIKYKQITKEIETVADEFHAEGIRFICKQCPLHELVTDGRLKWIKCKYADFGRTHLQHEACELFYRKVRQGEVEPTC